MMGGMGEEQEYTVNLAPAASPKRAPEEKAPAEEEEAGDMGDDVFAMMGGMVRSWSTRSPW